MKTLYKKDSKGKIRVWKIYTNNDELIQESGLLDGKLVKNSKICTPKNVGKSNETTGNQQALLELESECKSKLDEGYFPTKELAESEEVILPMLAKSYDDEKHKIDWSNCFIQPKLDGMRCLAIIIPTGLPGNSNLVGLKSRDGKVIENMGHIIAELAKIKTNEKLILDGELYAHGLSFQENMKLIKKYRPNETEKVHYHVYDMVSNECFTDRFNAAFKLIEGLSYVEDVPTFLLDKESLKNHHGVNLKEGYEGSIIRWGNEPYKINGRSFNLLKYKDFQDIAAKIIDIEPAEQRPEWGVPVLEFKGKTFRAGMKYSHEERKEFLSNKNNYIGKTAEIRFFEWTDDGLPRFPVMVGIRLDK